MKHFIKNLLFSSLLSVLIFSCNSTPKKTENVSLNDSSIKEKIEELRSKIDKYDLEIYDSDNFAKAEAFYKESNELSSQTDGKVSKGEIDKNYADSYELYKTVVKNSMPLYANAQRLSAIKERDKANSILSHRTANEEYENAALVFLKGEDDVLAENYEQAAANFVEARVGYESSYNIAKAYYDKSNNSIKELDQAVKEIKKLQDEIDGYQGSKS